MTYADEVEAARLIGFDPMVDPARAARLSQLNEELSRTWDEQCHRTFGGGVVTPSMREIVYRRNTVMVLPWPVMSITAIATGGTWNGTGWTGQTSLTAADWRAWTQDTEGRIWALQHMTGVWDGSYRITGVWADNPGGDVPDDVVAIVTWLVVEHEMLDHTSPAGIEGPSGMELRPRNPWSYERTKQLIKKYRLPRMVV